MGKAKRTPVVAIGQGEVTPRQIAYLVDCYLANGGYFNTRSHFRTEASSLLSHSPPQETFKNLLGLDAIINEYVNLKEAKILIEQEKARLDLERNRVSNLLAGIHELMNTYNASSSPLPPHPPAVVSSSSGCPSYASPGIPPLSTPSIGTVCPDVKRRKVSSSENEKIRSVQRSVYQTSTVAKNLFHQPWLSSSTAATVPPTMSSPNTPPHISAPATFSAVTTGGTAPLDATPTSCTVITTERMVMSPCKNLTYYSRDQCIASSSLDNTTLRISKRDGVKSRLNFDGSDSAMTLSEPEKGDMSGAEMVVYPDSYFADLLGDLENASGSSFDGELTSNFAQSMYPELDSFIEGITSISECITIRSPAKEYCKSDVD